MKPPDQLAREVRDALLPVRSDDPLTGRYSDALAALAELQAQAEAGQRLAKAVRFHRNEQESARSMQQADQRLSVSLNDYDRALAAASPSPADQEACTGYCVGVESVETFVEDLACPVHGIEAQERAKERFPDRQAWLDSLRVSA